MADFDLAKALVEIGVPEDIAKGLQTEISGGDLTNLVNALNQSNIGSGIQQASRILAKYGVRIQEDTKMDHKSYLNALLDSARNGSNPVEVVEQTINEWLKPISESTDRLASILALEGYNYCTNVGQNGSLLIDWLEDNSVDYQTNGQGMFSIKCEDRETAYRVGTAINRIMGKVVEQAPAPAETEEAIVGENKGKAGQKVVKDQNVSKYAAAKLSKVSGGAHNSELRKAATDPLDRNSKHKGNRFDIRADEDLHESEFSIGQNVMVGEVEGTVKIPRGPNGTIGVMTDGVLNMVEAADVARLDERVLGVSTVNPLFRLRELAGLPPTEMAPVEPLVDAEDEFAAPEAPVADLGGDDIGADLGADPLAGDDFGDELGDDLGADPLAGDDLDMDPLAGDLGAPEMGGLGVPGELGADPMQAAGMGVVQSEAYGMIEDHLNSIQTQLGDIKLSEYKSLVKKLEDLAGQVRSMGRDYLGERRKK